MENIDKYNEVLNQYKTQTDANEVSEKVNKIIHEKVTGNNSIETYKLLYSCLDLTSLNSTDTKEDIWQLTQAVNDADGASDIPNIAAICVYPNLVETVKEALTAEEVKIAGVAGGFPNSQTFIEVKIAETALTVANGADEIDTVINLGCYLSGNYEEMCQEIDEIKHACRNAQLKVILETGALPTLTDVKKASILAMYSGADFLKTSTGKFYEGVSTEAVYVMCEAIKEYFDKTGRKIGIKVAGSISTTEDAIKYFTIVKEILGNDWCNNSLFRIGASRLAENLLKHIR